MTEPDIQVVEDAASVCAETLLAAVREGGHVVLTGGSTPRAAYEIAARSAEAFAGAKLWFGDERCVAADDERSNYRMAKEAMLDPIAAAGVTIDFCRRVKGELGPEEGANDYASALADAGAPPFGLVLLGLGPDGHIASMFPGQPSLDERSRLVLGVPEAGHEPYVPRVTMTFAALAQADHVLLMATGESKRDAVARSFGSAAQPSTATPGSLLAQHVSRLTVLLDSDAAAGL